MKSLPIWIFWLLASSRSLSERTDGQRAGWRCCAFSQRFFAFQPLVRSEDLAAQSIGAPEDGTSCGVKQNCNLACRKAGSRMAPQLFVTFRSPKTSHHA